MAYASVQQLIRDASITAQKTAPEEDMAIQGGDPGASDNIELQTGLRLLNQAITTNNLNGNNLALVTNEQFIVAQGESELVLDGWSKLLKIRYLLGNVWNKFPLADLNTFLNQQVIENASGIPLIAYPQRTATGITLKYFFPVNQSYTFDIWGYKSLVPFNNLSDPLIGFDAFYELYYLYELAYRIQNFYQIPHTPYVLEQRMILKNELNNIKERRIDIRLSATSQAGSGGHYSPLAQNMLRGYEP